MELSGVSYVCTCLQLLVLEWLVMTPCHLTTFLQFYHQMSSSRYINLHFFTSLYHGSLPGGSSWETLATATSTLPPQLLPAAAEGSRWAKPLSGGWWTAESCLLGLLVMGDLRQKRGAGPGCRHHSWWSFDSEAAAPGWWWMICWWVHRAAAADPASGGVKASAAWFLGP
jgi:hypothetical protein